MNEPRWRRRMAVWALALLPAPVFAQQPATVTGRVTSDAGAPLGSASVFLEGMGLGTIADAEGLPLAYLEHLVQRLRKAELVESHRGAHGGYTLARGADEITMADVVRALEGDIAPIECITADADGVLTCAREGAEPCPTKLLWTRVQGSIVRTLNDMTLDDLVQPLRKTETAAPV